jgi:hypothetical protein
MLTIAIGGRQPDPPAQPREAGRLASPQPLPHHHPGHEPERTSPAPAGPPGGAGANAANAATPSRGAAPHDQRYSVDELRAELRRFERQLRAASLKETSVTTYVDRTGRFLKWLSGDYSPRGPN